MGRVVESSLTLYNYTTGKLAYTYTDGNGGTNSGNISGTSTSSPQTKTISNIIKFTIDTANSSSVALSARRMYNDKETTATSWSITDGDTIKIGSQQTYITISGKVSPSGAASISPASKSIVKGQRTSITFSYFSASSDYEFVQWDKALLDSGRVEYHVAGDTTSYSYYTNDDENCQIIAKFKAKPKIYDVFFYDVNGKQIKKDSVSSDSKVTFPANQSKEAKKNTEDCIIKISGATQDLENVYTYYTNYTFKGWKCREDSNIYTSSSVIRPSQTLHFDPAFTSTDGKPTFPTLGTLPEATKVKGYTFSYFEYTSGENKGLRLESTQSYTSAYETAKAVYDPVSYNILYALSYTTGRDVEDLESWISNTPTPTPVSYNGTATLSNDKSTYRGHTNPRWTTADKSKTFDLGASVTINESTGLYNEDRDVTLYTKWSPINHNVTLNYATGVSGGKGTGVKSATEYYNIDDYYTATDNKPKKIFYRRGSPLTTPFGDYVFKGWTNVRPKTWDTYHGLYKNEVELENDLLDTSGKKIDYERHSEQFDIVQLSKNGIETADLNDSNFHDDKYAPKNLYALWLVSGKYIKIYNSGNPDEDWRKIDSAYIYVYDSTTKSNTWKLVTDMFFKSSSSEWKKEVGH